MTPVSVLTIVKNRAAHLDQLVEGLRRSRVAPDELIVVDMSDEPVRPTATDFPIRLLRLDTVGLPLAQARNCAAAAARSPHLVFLDVDCIPLHDCLGRLVDELERADALLCADIRYLGRDDAAPGWSEAQLLRRGRRHPVRDFPPTGVRAESDPGLFWSLGFAIRKTRFEALGGFDEAFIGYGGEDTDFGFRAARAGVPLLFVGGALACHQYHESFEPPVQHLDDILRNAAIFRARWGRWPMLGWLEALERMGLIRSYPERFIKVRRPDANDFDIARIGTHDQAQTRSVRRGLTCDRDSRAAPSCRSRPCRHTRTLIGAAAPPKDSRRR